MNKIRVGQGYDVHRFAPGLPFILGGVEINHDKGCVAHSDGDVLIHAICDALLGAANLRDIGYHFPDNSTDFKGIDSAVLLERVLGLLAEKAYKIGNLDCTICLQKPKIKDLIPQMKKKIAAVLQLSEDDVSIKATTTEKLGFVGEEKGIAAYCVVLLYQ